MVISQGPGQQGQGLGGGGGMSGGPGSKAEPVSHVNTQKCRLSFHSWALQTRVFTEEEQGFVIIS